MNATITAEAPQQKTRRAKPPKRNTPNGNSPLAKKKKINWNVQIPLLMMCLPGLILTLIFGVFPKFGMYMAFSEYNYVDGIFGSPFVGFDNFKYIFSSGEIWTVVLQTIGYHFLLSIPQKTIQIFLAIMLYYVKSKFASKVFQEVSSVPYLLTFTMMGYILLMLLGYDTGLINGLLETLGFERISWYTTAWVWPIIVLIVNLWWGAGIGSIYEYAILMGVDSSLYESIQLDGGGRRHEIRHVMLPALMPMIVLEFITGMAGILSAGGGASYSAFNALTGGLADSPALYQVTSNLSTYTMRSIFSGSSYGITTALGICTAIFSTVMLYLTNWIVRKINADYAYI